ncbi:hypothetical protein EC973_006015 [Apophysomyces ossiformis]|uniref:Uncharacterized protein n=1 Tax=Apophysomyces ossiformis TaxID=679940 RepID=A0A8H7BVM5_9FUNG|nr:hypothetical protein EC973_006015 [Apophysomyces ossiformis]
MVQMGFEDRLKQEVSERLQRMKKKSKTLPTMEDLSDTICNAEKDKETYRGMYKDAADSMNRDLQSQQSLLSVTNVTISKALASSGDEVKNKWINYVQVNVQRVVSTVKQSLHILRKDLEPKDEDIIMDLIRTKAEKLTNCVFELSLLTNAAALTLVDGETVDLTKTIPEYAFRNDLCSPLVLKAPTKQLQQHLVTMHDSRAKMRDPQYGFLSQNHLSYISTHYMGSSIHRVNDGKKFWKIDFLIDEDHPIQQIPKGLSQTMKVYVRQLSTSFQNIWNGKAVRYLLHRLVILLIRFSLAPEKEEDLHRRKEKAKKDVEESKEAPKRMPSLSAVKWRIKRQTTRLKKLQAKYEQGIITDPRPLQKLSNIIGDLHSFKRTLEKRKKNPKMQRQDRKDRPLFLPVIDPELDDLILEEEGKIYDGSSEDDENDDDIDDLDYEEQQEEQQDDTELDEEELEDEAMKQSIQTKSECSIQLIKWSLSPASYSSVPTKEGKAQKSSQTASSSIGVANKEFTFSDYYTLDFVTQAFFKKQYKEIELTDKEAEAMVKIYGFLKPYVLAPTCEPAVDNHPLINAQLVILANDIFEITGYQAYSKSISPAVKPSAVYPLVLNPLTTYEVLCHVNDELPGYDIVTPDGRVISGSAEASTYRENIMGAFFNLGAIDHICKRHGQDFDYTMKVTSHGTAILQDTTRQGRQAVQSKYGKINGKRAYYPAAAYNAAQQETCVVNLDKEIKASTSLLKQMEKKRTQLDEQIREPVRQGQKVERRKFDEQILAEQQKLQDLRHQRYLAVQCEDVSHMLDLTEILNHDDVQVLFSGTDYGIITMSESIASTFNRFQYHHQLYKYFTTSEHSEGGVKASARKF